MKDTKRISETGDRFNPRKGVKDASPFVSLTLKAAFSFQSPQGVKDASNKTNTTAATENVSIPARGERSVVSPYFLPIAGFQSPQGVKDASIVINNNNLINPSFNPRKG